MGAVDKMEVYALAEHKFGELNSNRTPTPCGGLSGSVLVPKDSLKNE